MDRSSHSVEAELAAGVAQATAGAWTLAGVRPDGGRLLLDVATPDGALVLEANDVAADVRAYRVIGALALGYRGRQVPGPAGALDACLEAIADVLAECGLTPWNDRAEVAGPAPPSPGFPTPWHRYHLDTEPALDPSEVEAFRRDGHVLLRRALLPDVVNAARPVLLDALGRHHLPPAEERPDAYARAFTQLVDLWPTEPSLRAFGLCRRLAAIAAQLLGVERVRLFCEDWLVKEPGAGITPWHQDGAVMPFEPERSLTLWIPLQPVREGEGLMRFARGSHRLGRVPVEDISDTSEAEFDAIIADNRFRIATLPPVFVGDVSVHHGFTIHGAGPNTGDRPRPVLALHCFAETARIVAPTTPKMARLLEHAAPDRQPGDPAASNRWPSLPYVEVLGSPERPVHLRAQLLGGAAGGDGVRTDVWIEDGRIRFEPGPGRRTGDPTLVEEGGFLTSGLVEAHSHISYPTEPHEPADTLAWMNARRRDYAATGVTLLRDMGALSDGICGLVDEPGLPRVQASGMMVIPQSEPPFTPTAPEDLVRAFAERVEAGGRWVKVFSDWSTEFRGRRNSGFSESDGVAYPQALLTEAVAAAHALGGRVGAHCFTRAGARAAIRAGVDSLEHGWGVDAELLGEMADRGIAWAPLAGIAPIMWADSTTTGDTSRADWVERAVHSLAQMVPLAESLGVRLLAGTDMFPEVTVADEVAALHALGLSRSAALAAATTAGRAWLGEPGLVEGAPADLVLYRRDPRDDLAALLAPARIFLGGVAVAPTLARVRPEYTPWALRETLIR